MSCSYRIWIEALDDFTAICDVLKSNKVTFISHIKTAGNSLEFVVHEKMSISFDEAVLDICKSCEELSKYFPRQIVSSKWAIIKILSSEWINLNISAESFIELGRNQLQISIENRS